MISAATIAGCTSSEDPNSTNDPNPSDNTDSSENSTASDDSDETRSFDDYVTNDGVKIGLDEIELSNSITLESESLLDRSSKVAVLVSVTAKNISNGTRNLPDRDEFNLLAGTDQFDAFSDPFSSDTIVEPVSGELYYGQTNVHPGVAEEGWILFEVPRSLSEITIAWSDSFDDSDRYGWTTAIEPDQLPDLQVSSVSVAEPVRIGENSEVAVSITNEGGTAGTYSADYEIDLPIESDSGQIEQEVAAGDTEMWTTTITPRAIGDGLLEIESEEVALRFSIGGAQHQFGETVQTPSPENAYITVSEPILTQWYEYERYDGMKRVESESNEQFAIVQIEAKNRTNSSVNSFGRRSVTLSNSTNEYEAGYFEGISGPVNPVDGSQLNSFGISLSAGESETYVVLFEIPADIGVDDLEFFAEWSLEFMTDTKATWR
ncbi:hypothetical protein [Haloterrigena salina]|uniref:hypothetical protein n=1 Tax=Haloterrigena salina TaxID=504937 RepID=UPI000AECDC3E|nr:hypothetical protein [Haloterrigena salina]